MRLLPLSFTTEGSSHNKRISTDAILALTSLPIIFMDLVASLTHDPLPKRYIDRTRVQRLKFILPPIGPRNLILGALSSFSRKFLPTKITRYTVCWMWHSCTHDLVKVALVELFRVTQVSMSKLDHRTLRACDGCFAQ